MAVAAEVARVEEALMAEQVVAVALEATAATAMPNTEEALEATAGAEEAEAMGGLAVMEEMEATAGTEAMSLSTFWMAASHPTAPLLRIWEDRVA